MAQVTVATGYDVDYYLDQVGVDYYLSADGEPPGIWAGKAAGKLGLHGKVGGGGAEGKASAETMRALFHYDIGPDGVPLGTAQRRGKYPARAAYAQVEETIQKRVTALGRFATPEEKREIRLQERAKMRTSVPYYDMTFSAEKTVSLMHASLRAAAKRGWDEERSEDAEQFEARAQAVEDAVMAGASRMLEMAEQRGAIVRTGHHSASSGEFRDADGFVAVKFPQHMSRALDPQLHTQITILNRAQRADGADDKWRSLDARPLFRERLGLSAHAGLREAQELARMGFPLVKRADGNGFEIGGVDQQTQAAFSKRSGQISGELEDLLIEYRQLYGREPDRRTLFKLRKRVTLSTREVKAKTKRPESETAEDRGRRAEDALAAWVRQARDASVQELDSLHEAAEAYAAEHPEARPEQLPSEPERARMIRAAVAEVQKMNATWTRGQLEWELYRQLVVLPAGTDWEQYLDGMADDALSGRVDGAHVIRIAPVPDVVDVSGLDHRKDGTSVYRPAGEALFVTPEHLDTEGWILDKAVKAAAPQLVTDEQAEAAVSGTALDHLQRRVVRGLLTSSKLISCLVAPAGTGKTFVTAGYAKGWTDLTGGRVFGLTLSENAARVMAGEARKYGARVDTYNIARFFANKIRPQRGDVLVLDEASQLSTTDLARIISLALQTGARIVQVGDTEQLGAVEAGGLFALIAEMIGHWNLTEVRRFTSAWEGEASLRLRADDTMALASYYAHGRIYEGPQDRMYDDAVDQYMSRTARGEQPLLMAGSNEEAAALARLVRERRVERGEITGAREVTLKDGNAAGAGDLIRARLNARIDAGGQQLTNRDTLRITEFIGDGSARFAVAQRQTGPGQWSAPFDISAAYLEESAELAYAGNVYVAQGATIGTGLLVAAEGMGRRSFYVGMTRGRDKNIVFTVTGAADPAGMSRTQREAYAREANERAARLLRLGEREAAAAISVIPPEPAGMRDRAPWEAVLTGIMQRDDRDTTATEQMRAAQAFVTNTRHLLTLSEALWWKDVVPQIDEAVRQRISPSEYRRYLADPERPALLQALRAHEIGGRSIAESLDAVTDRDLTGARSIAAVLHGRLGKGPAPATGETKTWAERGPQQAPEAISEAQVMLDQRQAELGRLAAERPEPWALDAWGVPPREPGALRADWEHRAGLVASYREAAGITDPKQAIGPVPVAQAQIREAFQSSVRALALPDEAAMLRAMGQGALEAQVTERERALVAAPPDVSARLDSVERQHEAQVSAAEVARAAGRAEAVNTAEILARIHETELMSLRIADAARREWAEATADQDAAARAAERELLRRGIDERLATSSTERAEAAPEPTQDAPDLTPERETEAEFLERLHRVATGQEAEPAAPEPEAEPVSPERAAFDAELAELDARLDSIGEKIDAMPDAEARREAQIAEYIDEPGIRPEAEAEAAIEPTWTPGTHSGPGAAEQQEVTPEADAEAEIEM